MARSNLIEHLGRKVFKNIFYDENYLDKFPYLFYMIKIISCSLIKYHLTYITMLGMYYKLLIFRANFCSILELIFVAYLHVCIKDCDRDKRHK